MTLTTLTILSALLSPTAQAGGLFTPDQGVHAQAQGGAFVASADDISALYWNPAALIHLEGWGLAAGLTLDRQPFEFQREGGEGRWKDCHPDEPECLDPTTEDHQAMLARPYDPVTNDAPWRPIPQLGLHYRFPNKPVVLALGLTTPVAAWLDFPNIEAEASTVSPARYRMVRGRTDQARIALGVAWRPVPHFTLGLTGELVYLHFLQRFTVSADLGFNPNGNVEDPRFDADVRFEATGFMPYGSIGVIASPVPEVFDIALNFQPPLPATVPGTLRLYKEAFAGIQSGSGEDTKTINLDTTDDDLKVRVTLPMILRGGLAVRPHPRVLIELATVIEFWNQTTEIQASGVDAALVDAEGRTIGEQIRDTSPGLCGAFIDCDGLPTTYEGDDGEGNVALPAGYRTTGRVSLGGRAIAVEPSWTRPGVLVRAGAFYESNGVPDAVFNVSAPDNHKVGVGLGATIDFRGFGLSLAYSRVFIGDRTITGSTGSQIAALPETVPNTIDNGTYRNLDVDLLNVQLLFNIGKMLQKKEGATGRRPPKP